MSTPVSADDPYLTVSDFLDFRDVRTICQLMHDDDTFPDTVEGMIEELEDSDTDPGRRLLKILAKASGKLEGAALAGGRYTVADLQALTGNQLEYLKGLISDLAIRLCYERRPTLFGDPPAAALEADSVLNAIAQGVTVFGIQEVINSGHMTMTTNTERDVLTRNSMVVQAEGFFGRRANRIPPRG